MEVEKYIKETTQFVAEEIKKLADNKEDSFEREQELADLTQYGETKEE